MRIPSFAQLKSFIRRVLGLPMPSLFDSVFDAQVNEATMPVDPVLRLYIAARGRRSSDLESTLSDSPVRIQTVRLMKRLNTRFEHEYLVADLVSGNGRRTNVIVIGELKVERAYDSRHGNALKNASADASRASSDSTPGPSTPSGSSPLSAMFNRDPIPAKDTITFNPANTSADTTVFLYTFGEASAPSLLDLLVAADTLSSQYAEYILFERQCYWYAGMLLRVLLGDIDADPKVRPGAAAQNTRFSPAFIPNSEDAPPAEPVLAGRAGTFKNLFNIVTQRDIDLLYHSEIKQAYQSRQAEVRELLEAPRLVARQAEEDRQARREAEEALQKSAQETARQAEAAQEATRQAEAARAREESARQAEAAARAREESARQAEAAARAREDALQEEMARMREELSRLKVAATESHGAPPHAQ
ncbi:hypothetical protein VTO73DRAFT_10814 [Trametes versicolor]